MKPALKISELVDESVRQSQYRDQVSIVSNVVAKRDKHNLLGMRSVSAFVLATSKKHQDNCSPELSWTALVFMIYLLLTGCWRADRDWL